MTEQIARYKPGDNVTVKAKALLAAGRFVKIVGIESGSRVYEAEHATAGYTHPFGVTQRDSADPATEPPKSTGLLVETVRRGAVARVEAAEEIPVTSEVAVGASGKVVVSDAAVAAFLDKGVQGDNNAVHYEASVGGDEGNEIEVELLNTGKEKALSVDVDGNVISVTLKTNNTGAGEVTSTAAEVIAAINEHDAASQLIVASNKGSSTGAGVIVAFAKAALSGGADATGGSAAVGRACSTAKSGEFAEIELY